jgi:hypothetical protein
MVAKVMTRSVISVMSKKLLLLLKEGNEAIDEQRTY